MQAGRWNVPQKTPLRESASKAGIAHAYSNIEIGAHFSPRSQRPTSRARVLAWTIETVDVNPEKYLGQTRQVGLV